MLTMELVAIERRGGDGGGGAETGLCTRARARAPASMQVVQS